MGPRLGRLLDRAALAALFNDAFSEYVVPLRLDEDAFGAHVELNDIDLSTSPVAFDGDRPVAFALIAIRGDDAWIGGMGTLPSERERDVIVWSLDGPDDAAAPARRPSVDAAHAWIAAHRPSREPWQRADVSLARMRERRPLGARAVERDGVVATALIHDDIPSVLQIAALDETAAADLLRGRAVRVSNAPAGEPASRALERLGAHMVARQHEMRIAL